MSSSVVSHVMRWLQYYDSNRFAAARQLSEDRAYKKQTVSRQFIANNIDRGQLLARENKLCGRPPQYATALCKLTFDLLTLKVVSESGVT